VVRSEEIKRLIEQFQRPLQESLSQETRLVIDAVKAQYRLDWNGIHGISHWMRVYENGMRLASKTGADKRIVELFAFLHDSCRKNDNEDSAHGARAASFIDTLQGTVLNLDQQSLETLKAACINHSLETCRGNATMQTCYDADRLDLGRRGVSIEPDPEYLCTEAAKDPETIRWAYQRSQC
jgi:uncharacterized protein